MDQIAGRVSSITVTPDRIDFFGPKKTKRVLRVKNNRELARLHQEVLAIIESSNALINDTRHLDSEFVPHVTIGGNNTIETITIHEMYLVSLNEKSIRQVVEVIKFG